MSRRKNNHEIQRMDQMGMMDPFTQMRKMMRGFGGFNDDFMGSMQPFGMGRDPFEDMFKFSDIHKNMHSNGKQGSFVSQTFVSSSKMGPDGKIHREDFFENNMGEHKGGNTISQKQQAYKNNQGVNRIAQERMLNDRGRKIVREKKGGEIEETNHYYNIDEEEAHNFDNDWRRRNEEIKFLDRHQKHMQSLGYGQQPRQRQLGYQPSSFQQAPREQRPSRQLGNGSTYGSSRGSQRSQPSQYGRK